MNADSDGDSGDDSDEEINVFVFINRDGTRTSALDTEKDICKKTYIERDAKFDEFQHAIGYTMRKVEPFKALKKKKLQWGIFKYAKIVDVQIANDHDLQKMIGAV